MCKAFEAAFNAFFRGLPREKPSPPDIVPRTSISVVGSKVIIDLSKLNIPFTGPPIIVSIMGVPDTNSMDGAFDAGHNEIYVGAADEEDQQVLVNWIDSQYLTSDGKLAADCVYRVMKNDGDDPWDFTKPHLIYTIHRLYEIGDDKDGRYFIFKGINNSRADSFKARDKNIMYLSAGTIY